MFSYSSIQPFKAIIFHMRPSIPIRMIYSKPKPIVVKEKKVQTLDEKIEEESHLSYVDRDRGFLSFIATTLLQVAPNNPVLNWTFAQVSVAIRNWRVPDACRILVNSKITNNLIHRQNYSPSREENLGSDLAAAHFLLALGCQVRFAGHTNYVKRMSILSNGLPLKYDSSYKLEAIKIDDAEIFDNGYKSLRNLQHVKHFDASNNLYFNDAQLDRVFCQFGGTLESIDLSNCLQLTSSGLTSLARFRKLKHAKMENLEHVAHLEFLCLLLKESSKDLKFTGVTLPESEETRILSNESETEAADRAENTATTAN